MRVQKRNGNLEEVSFDKIQNRLKSLCNLDGFKKLKCDVSLIAQKVCSEIYDCIKTEELDRLSSEIAISLYSKNIEYKELASRIIISNHNKNTNGNFYEVSKLLYDNNIINQDYYDLIEANSDNIESEIKLDNDYLFDFFGFKTLEKSYLLKCNGKIVERPQYLLMRVALSIHRNNLDKAFETYNYMSTQYFIHATPTLFNAGTNREQFSSCFLLSMEDDSVQGIFDTLTDCAKISKYSGGIGLSIHNIRANGSYINGTNGISNGIVPMLRVFNDTARYIDQGGGKRNGSFAIYLEPWHADVFDFLELKKNHGNELERARDLFYGLWICDLFMKRVEKNEKWSLFCPNKCPRLFNKWGDDFEQLYCKYESEGKYTKQVDAQKLWFHILTSQIETGTPYLVYKDHCNRKSNQQNLGTIRSSNLCTEIIQYSDKDETAVCNLASISLKKCVDYQDFSNLEIQIYAKPECIYCTMAENLCKMKNIKYEKLDYTLSPKNDMKTYPQIYYKNKTYQNFIGGFTELNQWLLPKVNYQRLKEITKIITRNLNNIIDYNFYPTEKTKRSNLRHRPIGIGVQGLANLFYELKIPFDSEEAKRINSEVFETIYYGSLEASMEISKERSEQIHKYKVYKKMLEESNETESQEYKQIEDNIQELFDQLNPLDEELNRDDYLGTYSSYIGSPVYNGELQFDMWNHKVDNSLHDWSYLRNLINLYGIRNSLLIAPMPTASTSQILGNYECIEPVLTNIYSRRVLAGDYMVLNEYLIQELQLCNLWNEELKNNIIKNNGSIQSIEGIPHYIKNLFKTVWEIKQKVLIDLAIDRGKFICQSQSLNLFMEAPTFEKLSSMHFYGWKNGLKTGIYYLRSRPSSTAIQFSIKPDTCESCSG
jgi:ribonucleoside-diphosphate reductase subunit M1